MSTELDPLAPAGEGLAITRQRPGALMMIGWFSVGMAVAAVGILIGTEIRSRYKFNRRTPYDFYASAGEQQASEFGVGI